MNKGIFGKVTEDNTFAIDKFNGNSVVVYRPGITHYEYEVIRHAIQSFKFLVQDGRVRTFEEFAEVIVKYYDINNPQTAEVVRVLNLQ